jgi:hypothetical protein
MKIDYKQIHQFDTLSPYLKLQILTINIIIETQNLKRAN